VGGVGLGGEGVAAAHGVEVPDENGVSLPGFGSGDFFDAVAVPQAAGATEGGEATFCGDSGAGEDEEAVGWGEVHGPYSDTVWKTSVSSEIGCHPPGGVTFASTCWGGFAGPQVSGS